MKKVRMLVIIAAMGLIFTACGAAAGRIPGFEGPIAMVGVGNGVNLVLDDSGDLWMLGLMHAAQTHNRVVGWTPESWFGESRRILSDAAYVSVNGGGILGDSRNHAMIIKTDGSLYRWGITRVGFDRPMWYDEPIKVMDDVVAISAGLFHYAAITSDGGLWLWGFNYRGQLGDGTTLDRSLPVLIMDGVTAVSAGQRHTLAIRQDGSLWGWGAAAALGIGDPAENPRILSPVKIMDDVVAISAGAYHSLAITSDGSLWAWGGRHAHEPEKIMSNAAAVSAGHDISAAITHDGSLWMWGDNHFGSVGVEITEPGFVPKPVKVLENVQQVFTGGGPRHNQTMAITTDGALWAWGNNDFRQLSRAVEATLIARPTIIHRWGY